MPRPVDQDAPTPLTRREALLKTRRETMRVVKRTLIGVAFFAAAYYLGLLAKERREAAGVRAPEKSEKSDERKEP